MSLCVLCVSLCVCLCSVCVVPQSHSSELSEQCFLPSHHSVRWTHWWLLQDSSLSVQAAEETETAQSAQRPPPTTMHPHQHISAVTHSQQLASSTSRGQSGKPSQIMLALMHTLLPGHSHRARSEQPDRDRQECSHTARPHAADAADAMLLF